MLWYYNCLLPGCVFCHVFILSCGTVAPLPLFFYLTSMLSLSLISVLANVCKSYIFGCSDGVQDLQKNEKLFIIRSWQITVLKLHSNRVTWSWVPLDYWKQIIYYRSERRKKETHSRDLRCCRAVCLHLCSLWIDFWLKNEYCKSIISLWFLHCCYPLMIWKENSCSCMSNEVSCKNKRPCARFTDPILALKTYVWDFKKGRSISFSTESGGNRFDCMCVCLFPLHGTRFWGRIFKRIT